MCLTCGCLDAHLEMGKANITYEDVKAAADENGRSVAETLDIVERTASFATDARIGSYSLGTGSKDMVAASHSRPQRGTTRTGSGFVRDC